MNFCLIFVFASISGCLATIPRPRGVAISMASFYKPGEKFRCLDGTEEFPFEYINDDYCDCPDGSDEPGTSACAGGKFHCTNAGYKPLNILSSRVNDGICDCCDGTDEYNGNIECVNNCKELGKKMREENERIQQLQQEGFKQRQQFSDDGKKTRSEKQAQLEEFEKKKVELEAVKSDMEARKSDAEVPEKEAKERHENAWKEQLEKKKAEKDLLDAKAAFEELDIDKNNFVDAIEVMRFNQFDIDNNGEVSEEEAKEHLEQEERVDVDMFTQKIWPNIRDFFNKPATDDEAKGEDNSAEPHPPAGDGLDRLKQEERRLVLEERRLAMLRRAHERKQRIQARADLDEDDYDDEDDEDEEEDELEDNFDPYKFALQNMLWIANEGRGPVPGLKPKKPKPARRPARRSHPQAHEPVTEPDVTMTKEEDDGEADSNNTGTEEENMPDYDDQTKALIAAADEARNKFNEAEKQLKETENEISALNKYLSSDFGPEEEYSVLQGNCYEYTDREYTYKMCAYDRTSQRPKAGGSETSLGSWGRWDGPPEDKYAAQKYENGQNCWNGPNRSVKVNFKCGLEHKLISAAEPSRCEYEFDFETPARCSTPANPSIQDSHDEL